jgi:DNA-binding CsgD family transcriptional regulator
VWDRAGPLTAAEWELVRLHPHHSERILAGAPALRGIADLAVAHHERRDGSGYPRGTSGGQIGLSSSILAAADVAAALTETRPHRPALSVADRSRVLQEEVRGGRLVGDAVAAVLGVVDGKTPRLYASDDRLTPREQDVLKLVSRGATNRQVASRLGISSKTVNAHLEHIYRKLGVSCRAAAVFHAVQAGLLSSASIDE